MKCLFGGSALSSQSERFEITRFKITLFGLFKITLIGWIKAGHPKRQFLF